MTTATLNLQQNLIAEEFYELDDAIHDLKVGRVVTKGEPLVQLSEHALKELADLVYVCYQMAAAFDWDLQVALNRVHESNMSKLGEDGKPVYREDGKVLKGPNYKPPVLTDLVV